VNLKPIGAIKMSFGRFHRLNRPLFERRIMSKWKKRKLEPCSNCGLFGVAQIGHSAYWAIFCGACNTGIVSRSLLFALWKWNHQWRKMKKKSIQNISSPRKE